MLSCFSRVPSFATLWTLAHQSPLCMGFSRQEHWSGLPFPLPGDLPHPEIQPAPVTGAYYKVYLVQFSSVQSLSHVRLCDPMNRSTPGLPIHHQLPEFTQTHIHRVSDVIQPSHPVVPFSSCPQSLPASESFPMSQLFA